MPLSFLSFLHMAASDLHSLLAALISSPEHLGDFWNSAISHPPPLQLLLGGLLGEGEASQLLLCLLLTHKKWGRCLRWCKICGDHRRNRLTHIHTLLLHLLVHQNGHPPSQSLRELQILRRVAKIVIVDTPWTWASLHGTLLPIILHFSGNFGDLNFSFEEPLIHAACFPSFALKRSLKINILIKALSR